MCGISGVINVSSSARPIDFKDIEAVRRMIEVQAHRGPDDTGLCVMDATSGLVRTENVNMESNNIGIFGFDRLSIKDISIEGHQPMLDESKTVALVFNGEIYNDYSLRQEMIRAGYNFKSTTDTEVILALYLEYGFEKMILKLNGMFSIAIYDMKSREFWLARDRYGIKPLYYSINDGRLLFASELKAIIQHPDFKRELDMEAFNARLIFSRPSNKVLLKGVEILDPGYVVRIKYDEAPYFWKYYDINNYERRDAESQNISSAIEEMEAIFSDAVSRQMVSDVKVGCQLSGGIDSTIVSYFANKNKTDKLNDAVSIIDEKGVIGEEKYIDYVGDRLDLDLHKFTITPDYFVKKYESLVWHNDAPTYQPFFVCFNRLAEQAKKYVTVLLSGEGSDEIAGGYSRFSAGVYYTFIKKLSSDPNVKAYDSYAEYAISKDQTIINHNILFDEEIEKKLLFEEVDAFNSFSGTDFTKQLKYEITRRLPEALLRQDKMTMANSIENRVPFLDNEVVDYCMQLPEKHLLRFCGESPVGLGDNPFAWVHGKYIFKEIVANHFGRDFAYRKKQIMALDKRSIVTDKLFSDYLFDAVFPKMKERGILNSDYVMNLYNNAERITDSEFTSMWRAIGLETWCQLFL